MNTMIFLYKKINSLLLVCLVICGICFIGCTRVLDKRDLTGIPEDEVWSDITLATAFLNSLYTSTLPAWPVGSSGLSEESSGGGATMYGQLTMNDVDYWPYTTMRSINMLLDKVPGTAFSQTDKDQLTGQALFLRAWVYFQMVSNYGGVPLILHPQELSEDLLVSRNKTSECIAQIVKDLNEAAGLLPPSWTAPNSAGRITKGAALAFKGRVLLHYASEQFDPGQTMANRWTEAYNANKVAYDSLISFGYKLMPSFKDLWFTEGAANTEAVIVTRFNNPGRTHNRDAAVRPLDESQNAFGQDAPSLNLVQAFPMKNGLSITAPNSGYNPDAYWLNRDPRFEATVAYNGSPWPLSGKTGRIQWNFAGSQQTGGTATGFYAKKAVLESLKPFETQISGVDWIEMRLPEVMLNYAEAANEVGNTIVGYDMIKVIRSRAGIDAGADNMYGLKAAMTKAEMREAILFERRIELALENKRPQDLRRRRLYESVLNGTRRSGIQITLIAFDNKPSDFFSAYATGNINLNTNYRDYFREEVVTLDQANVINFKPEYYFYAIPQTHLQRNENLQQTNGWDGGSFDPLQ